MVFLYFLACPDWRKGYGFPDFFPAGNRSGLDHPLPSVVLIFIDHEDIPTESQALEA